MSLIYNLFTRLAVALLWIPALFNLKIRQFLVGRKSVWSYLSSFRAADKKLIWLHAASLGEFEQGLPVLEQLRAIYPDFQYLITFFSPSGYEVKKDKLPGFGVCYLPLDTHSNARKFLKIARPKIALFVKYEVWPNYFKLCHKLGIPLFMLSAIFKPEQIYFKPYGGLLRQALQMVSHFYVQDPTSAELLLSIGLSNSTISGDTRYDRVAGIRERNDSLDFMPGFKGNRKCFVAGSTWPEDHEVIFPFLDKELASSDFCVVIAPHKTDHKTVSSILEHFGSLAIAHSQATLENLSNRKVLVIDSIGLLTRIYAYADLAYVGGGFATGLHNTLEPAVFGIPVLIGPNYKGFIEAEALVAAGGLVSVSDSESFSDAIHKLLTQPHESKKAGEANSAHLAKSTGATRIICNGIRARIG